MVLIDVMLALFLSILSSTWGNIMLSLVQIMDVYKAADDSNYKRQKVYKNHGFEKVVLILACEATNEAEKAIDTFKNHFQAILMGVSSSFPMQLLDRLIPQTVLILNLLHHLNLHQALKPMHSYMACLTTMPCHLHHWIVQCRCMRQQTSGKHGYSTC